MKHRYFILVLTSLLILTTGCDKGTNISITDDEKISMSESENKVVSSKSSTANVAGGVSAYWEENVVGNERNYDEFFVDTSEYSRRVLFTANEYVTDFKVVSLAMEDVKEDGTPVYRTEVVYNHGELTPERGLLVTLAFPGDMPSYGIIYTDENSNERHFAIQESGKDGSLVMMEYK